MKPNVKMIDKSKNSFIYFQLGMIATMVAVLFVLEFNFETKAIKDTAVNKIPSIEEIIFTYNPKIETPKAEPRKTIVQKAVVQPKVINQFIISKKEVNDNVVKETAHQDTPKETTDAVLATDINKGEANPGPKVDEVFVVVEFLPMFPSCKGVSKEQQKECFDRALKTEIFKHLKYPERDLENKNEGTVYAQFIIDEKGNFTNIKTADNKRSTDEMKIAVEKAVKKLPKIIPAKQGTNDVKIRYTIPISFKINK